MVMMQGVGHFFSGFVLVKVPFPLTKGFKMMFQRGLQLNTLDTSYVSSVSWYFLVMYGLRGLLRLIIGDPTMIDRDDGAIQAGLGNGGGGGQFDKVKAKRLEGDSLEMCRYGGSLMEEAEVKILGERWEKRGGGKKKEKEKGGRNKGDDIYD